MRPLPPASPFSQDMLIDDLDLVCHAQAVALTYIECAFLTKPEFEEAARDFPGPMQKVRQKLKRVQLQRRLLQYLVKANGTRCCRSFIERMHASGFSYSVKQAEAPSTSGGDGMGDGAGMSGAEQAGVLQQLAELRSSQQALVTRVEEAQRLSDARMAKMVSALSAIQAAFEVWADVPPPPASAQPPGPPDETQPASEAMMRVDA